MENKVQFVLLGILSDYTMNGYELKNFMEDSISNFYKPSYGNIYPTLATLKELHFIEEVPERSNERTTRYHVTPSGYALFRERLLAPVDDIQFGNDHLLHLFFYHHLSRDEQIAKTTALIARYNHEVQSLTDLRELVKPRAREFQLATLDYGIEFYKKYIQFYQNLLPQMQEKTP